MFFTFFSFKSSSTCNVILNNASFADPYPIFPVIILNVACDNVFNIFIFSFPENFCEIYCKILPGAIISFSIISSTSLKSVFISENLNTPALLTNISRRFSLIYTSSIIFSTSPGCVASAILYSALPPLLLMSSTALSSLSSVLATNMTFAPRDDNLSAIPLPIPELPPVIIAI